MTRQQSVAEAKLNKILDSNIKFNEQLKIQRIPVSEASRS